MIRLIIIFCLFLTGCQSVSINDDDLTPSLSASQISLNQAALELSIIQEYTAEWLVQDPNSGFEYISLQELLTMANHFQISGNEAEARRLAEQVSGFVKLARQQLERNKLVAPEY